MLKADEIKYLSQTLKFWNELTQNQKSMITNTSNSIPFKKGDNLYRGESQCLGLILVKSGQLRAYITSEDGKQITLYRLLSLDTCILSASCMIKSINFNINLEIEKDSNIIIIPTEIFNQISEQNSSVKSFMLELMSSRFSDVMWVLDQFVFGSVGKRLAGFLLEHANLEQSNKLKMTHEFIANDLGTAREVITRLLNHFSDDKIIKRFYYNRKHSETKEA